jgi:hypothetical protein
MTASVASVQLDALANSDCKTDALFYEWLMPTTEVNNGSIRLPESIQLQLLLVPVTGSEVEKQV